MVWQRAHVVVPRVAFFDPVVRTRVLVGRHGRERDGRGLGAFGGSDVKVDEGLGDPVGGRGGATTAFGRWFGGGVGGRVWGRSSAYVGVAGAFAGGAGLGADGGRRGVRGGDAGRGVGGCRGRGAERGRGHLWTSGCVDGFEDAAFHVTIKVGRDTEPTTTRITHERCNAC